MARTAPPPKRAAAAKKSAPSAGAAQIAPLLQEAGRRLESFDFGSALQLYQQAAQVQPGNVAAAMGMAMVFNRTGRAAEALELLQKVWKTLSTAKPKPSNVNLAAVLAQLGLAQQQMGKLAESLESFRHALRLTPSDELARRIKQLEPLVSSPLPVQQLVLTGRALHAQKQLQEAAKTFGAALQLQADSTEALHGMALVLRDQGKSEEALPLLQRAVMLDPERAEFFNDIGLLFQDRADFEKAISFHKRAVKADPGFAFALINLGVAHKRLGHVDEAESAYRKALKINARSAEAHNNLGNLLRVKGDLKAAREHISKAVALKPGYSDAIGNLQAVDEALAQSAGAAKTSDKKLQTPSARTASPARRVARK